MFTGSPTTMPPDPLVSDDARRVSMSRDSLVRRSVVRAVAIVRLTSETAIPMVLAPRSSPIRRASAARRPVNALSSQIATTAPPLEPHVVQRAVPVAGAPLDPGDVLLQHQPLGNEALRRRHHRGNVAAGIAVAPLDRGPRVARGGTN